MPSRDDFRSNREYEEYLRRRRQMDRDPQRRMGGPEGRSFDDQSRHGPEQARYGAQNQRGRPGDYPAATGEAEAWRVERAGSRYDQDRARYAGRQREDRWRQESRQAPDQQEPWRTRGSDEVGYGGQEYGIEAHGSDFARTSSVVQRATDGANGRRLEERFGQDDRGDPPFRGEPQRGGGSGHVTWRDEGGTYGDSHLDRQDRAMEEFGVPHDYGFHPHDEEFEPHYTHWRDEQLRRHDDEYRRWRTDQQRQYDEDYKAWRGERRHSFGQTFSQWRSQRAEAAAKPAEGASGPAGGGGVSQASPAVQNATDGEARGGGDKDPKDGS